MYAAVMLARIAENGEVLVPKSVAVAIADSTLRRAGGLNACFYMCQAQIRHGIRHD